MRTARPSRWTRTTARSRSSSSTTSRSRSAAPAGLKPGTPLDFPVAVNSGPLPLEPGRYEWRLTIDGEADDDWRLPFSVRVEEENGTL